MYSTFAVLFRGYLQVCTFRAAPQDLPANPVLVILLLLAYTAVSVVLAINLLPLDYAAYASLLDTTITVVLTVGLLQIRKLENRAIQTIAALAGTGIVISLIAFPIVFWLGLARNMGVDASVPGILMLLMRIWGLAIMANILRHALNLPIFVGAILSLFYYWAFISVANVLLRPALQ